MLQNKYLCLLLIGHGINTYYDIPKTDEDFEQLKPQEFNHQKSEVDIKQFVHWGGAGLNSKKVVGKCIHTRNVLTHRC